MSEEREERESEERGERGEREGEICTLERAGSNLLHETTSRIVGGGGLQSVYTVFPVCRSLYSLFRGGGNSLELMLLLSFSCCRRAPPPRFGEKQQDVERERESGENSAARV